MSGLWKSFNDGGWGMYPIVFWSIVTIGVIVERAIVLYSQSSINKNMFLASMQKCILAGDIAKADQDVLRRQRAVGADRPGRSCQGESSGRRSSGGDGRSGACARFPESRRVPATSRSSRTSPCSRVCSGPSRA